MGKIKPKDDLSETELPDTKKEIDLNETAKNVTEITKDNFNDFAEFLGSYLELNLEKFGNATVTHHLDKVVLALKLKELGLLKEKGEAQELAK